MSENQSTTTLSTQPTYDIDWFLQFLVKMVNRSEEMFLSITLNVGGVLLSGELIGGKKYFEGFSEDLKKGGLDKETAESFKKLGDIYIKERELEQNSESEIINPPQYIHLRNARIFHPGGKPIPSNRGVWWRGRLNAVDGFILGVLSSG